MSLIIQTTEPTGLVGVYPRRCKMISTDTLATITAAGYLTGSNLQGNTVIPTDIFDVIYSFVGNINTGVGNGIYEEFTVSISNGIITLVPAPGNTPIATTPNHIAVFSNTTGGLTEDVATAINGGNIQAGSSGTAGTIGSFPSVALSGELLLAAVTNSSGNFNTVISNAASVAQSQVVSIPDGGAATSNFILNSGIQQMAAGSEIKLDKGTGTESSHAVTISKQSGVITTTSLTTAQYASETITLTNTLITTSSVVIASIMGGTNTTQGITVSATAGSNSSTIVLTNLNSSALNGTVIIGFVVL